MEKRKSSSEEFKGQGHETRLVHRHDRQSTRDYRVSIRQHDQLADARQVFFTKQPRTEWSTRSGRRLNEWM